MLPASRGLFKYSTKSQTLQSPDVFVPFGSQVTSMHGSAKLRQGRLRFPVGIRDPRPFVKFEPLHRSTLNFAPLMKSAISPNLSSLVEICPIWLPHTREIYGFCIFVNFVFLNSLDLQIIPLYWSSRLLDGSNNAVNSARSCLLGSKFSSRKCFRLAIHKTP